ncbi:hypothetical protein F5Y16DRAFT_414539 [Xylariaceae sp. FL0255]|nr:hypothetical protein F5Y16DRAFT_414539 [Xylariaceae sp. FL0255]
MVFPGRFSTGCKRCRQRKVKCDEAKPSCRRCYIYGKPCPGYTDQFHFRFENAAPKQQDKSSHPSRRRNLGGSSQTPSPTETEAVWNSNDAFNSSTQVILRSSVNPPPLRPPPDISHDQISLCYFVHRFVTPDEADSFPGHLSFLPSLFNHHGNGLLELATMSVAQMAAHNQFGDEKFKIQSYQNYGKAVRALRQTIQTEEAVTDDRVLATILLLCMFKDVGGEGQGDPGEHASGLYYILEKRGYEQLFTSRGFELFLLALLKLQVHSFMHKDDNYNDPGGMVELLSTLDPIMRALALMTKSLSLRHDLLKYVSYENAEETSKANPSSPPQQEQQQNTSRPDGKLSAILQACFESLEGFDQWDLEASTYWRNTFEHRTEPVALGEMSTRSTYPDTRTACTVILIRSARLILLLSILEYHDTTFVFSDPHSGPDFLGDREAWAQCVVMLKHQVHLIIDDVLWCVPFALGDLDSNGQSSSTLRYDGASALMILQPLRLVTACSYATPQQRQTCDDILDRMYRGIGLRSAVAFDYQQEDRLPGMAGLSRLMKQMSLSSLSPSPGPSLSPGGPIPQGDRFGTSNRGRQQTAEYGLANS